MAVTRRILSFARGLLALAALFAGAAAFAQSPGVTVGESNLSLNEGGAGTYTLVLNTAPSATTTVTATPATNRSPFRTP